MKSKQKRGADRLVRRMAKGVWPARMEVDCSGGELSSNGGSALLMMLAEQVRLFERASECFTDHRDPSKVAHPLVALLGQRILGLALGYEDLNDHDELRRDRALSTAMGRVECARSDCEPLAGKSTLNRMELSANGRDPAKARQITVDFDALDELLVELYLVWGERGQMPKRLVLDIDATNVELHGRQEHRFYHGYYHEYCYLPRLVFCNGWPVRTELRTSSGDVAAGVVETVEPLVDRLRKRFPQVPILIRADGAYCRDELMTWCEARGVDYVLGLPRNDQLKDRVQPLMDDLRDRLKRDPGLCAASGPRLPELRLSHARQLEPRTPRDRQGRMAAGTTGRQRGRGTSRQGRWRTGGRRGRPMCDGRRSPVQQSLRRHLAPEARRANGLRRDVLRPG